MYSDIVLYILSVQHQKELLHEAEIDRLFRQRPASRSFLGKVSDLPQRLNVEVMAIKNRYSKHYENI
jgi:hypothetical protein